MQWNGNPLQSPKESDRLSDQTKTTNLLVSMFKNSLNQKFKSYFKEADWLSLRKLRIKKKIFVLDIKITLKTCSFVHSPVSVWVLDHFVPIVLQQFPIWTLTLISPLYTLWPTLVTSSFFWKPICLCYSYTQELSNGFLLPIHPSAG